MPFPLKNTPQVGSLMIYSLQPQMTPNIRSEKPLIPILTSSSSSDMASTNPSPTDRSLWSLHLGCLSLQSGLPYHLT